MKLILMLLLVSVTYSQTPEQKFNDIINRTPPMVYYSDTDSSLDVESFPASRKIDPYTIARIFHLSGPVEERGFDEFLDPIIDLDGTARWEELRDALRESLYDLHVYKFGRIHKDIFIVGKYGTQAIAVHFKAVET